MAFSLPCVLFAGGKSSRMGRDKALLPFGGYSTLAEFQYRRLEKIFNHVYISTKDAMKFPFAASFIIDKSDVFAPTAGFDAAFESLSQERFFALGVDMPFVTQAVIKRLIQADSDDVDATVAQTQGKTEALCGIYHRSLHKRFEAMLANDEHKLAKLLNEAKTTQVPFGQKELFLNLNRPHEYQKAKEVYGIMANEKEAK